MWDQKVPGTEEGCVAGVKLSHPQYRFFISPAPAVSYAAAVLLDVWQAGVRLYGQTCAPSYPGFVPPPYSCHLPQSRVLHPKCINNIKALLSKWSDLCWWWLQD